jgi:hypothetical protein
MNFALIILACASALILGASVLGCILAWLAGMATVASLQGASNAADSECDASARAETILAGIDVTIVDEYTLGDLESVASPLSPAVRVLFARNVASAPIRLSPVRARLSERALRSRPLRGESERVAMVASRPMLLSPIRRARARRESGRALALVA